MSSMTRQNIFVWMVLGICHFGVTFAQSIGFTIYPQQVVNGLSYTVAWLSNGQPVTIELLRNGAREDTLFTSDGTTSSFSWQVQDDYSGGVNYSLQLTSGTTVVSAPVQVIEDEDGLVVSGSTIRTPSPTTLVTSATAISSAGTITSASGIVTSTGSASTTGSASPSAAVTSATGTTSPTSAPTNTPPSSSNSLSGGAIAGIVIGVLLAIALVGAGLWFWRHSKKPISSADPDPIASFLALGKRGGATGRTIKGTSPEVRHEEKIVADGEEGLLPTVPEQAELHGDSHIPWNELEEGPHPSIMNGRFEVDGRPMVYELSADSGRH